MKKKEIITPDLMDHKPHITEILNEHPLIQWIVDNRRSLLYIFVGVIAAIILITRFSMGAPGQKEADLIKAETEFVNIQRAILGVDTDLSQNEAITKLHQLLSKYPELNSKYDAPIAQAFIAAGKANDAQTYADQSLKRTGSNHLPLYQDFARTSLFIEKEQYQEALTQAQKLKTVLQDQTPKSTLFAYNLLRIALLQQALGNKNEELKTWQEWNSYSNSDAFKLINNQLESGGIKLSDYIAQRNK